MLQRILLCCFVLALFACKTDLGPLEEITKLETEIETNPDAEKAKNLVNLYRTYASQNPEDLETNSKFLYRSAGVNYRQNKYSAAVDDLKKAVHDYTAASNTPNATLLLAKILEENFKDKSTADLYKMGFVNAYPQHEQSAEIKTQLGENNTMSPIIKATETEFYAPTEANSPALMNRTLATKLTSMYDIFTTFNKAAPETADYLYKGAEISRSNNKFEKALSFYKKLYDNHPDYAKAPQALFLMGFTYENDFNDLDKAKALYEEFLQKYPKHELATSVQFSLKNLGKPAEDIIKSFEENKKTQEETQQ